MKTPLEIKRDLANIVEGCKYLNKATYISLKGKLVAKLVSPNPNAPGIRITVSELYSELGECLYACKYNARARYTITRRGIDMAMLLPARKEK